MTKYITIQSLKTRDLIRQFQKESDSIMQVLMTFVIIDFRLRKLRIHLKITIKVLAYQLTSRKRIFARKYFC